MSRSGYGDVDDPLMLGRWRAQVNSAMRGKRGQAFLRELAEAMDVMPQRVLISDDLIDSNGDCCAIGVICKARNLDVSSVDPDVAEDVAELVGIARQMSAEIAYENDEGGWNETPEKRWIRMRKWVHQNVKPD